MKEIVTLQFGRLSNYVATHFWNTQESYFTYEHAADVAASPSLICHDVHWRAGVGPDGSDTFFPRTLIYDLKGGFGALRKINALYESSDSCPDATENPVWASPPSEYTLPRVTASRYQQSLDAGTVPPELCKADVRYWSDFNKVNFHPRSALQLLDYELGSHAAPFDSWYAGADLFHSLEQTEDLVDRDLRHFLEEADQLQGFQLFTSTEDSWAGFATAYLERIRDDFGKTPIWTWAIQGQDALQPENQSAALRRIWLSNVAKSFLALAELASVFVPLSLPRLHHSRVTLDPTSPWHVSALLATGLESAALSSRVRDIPGNNAHSLADLVDTLNIRGNQRMAKLNLAVGSISQGVAVEAASTHSVPDVDQDRQSVDSLMDMSTLPAEALRHRVTSVKRADVVFGEVETTRGDSEPANLGTSSTLSGRIKCDYRIPFPVLDNFPKIFSSPQAESSVGVRASLRTVSSIARDLYDLSTAASQVVCPLEREFFVDNLRSMADAYKDGWSSDSENDDGA